MLVEISQTFKNFNDEIQGLSRTRSLLGDFPGLENERKNSQTFKHLWEPGKIAHSLGGSEPLSNTWFLRPMRGSPPPLQTASRSVQPLFMTNRHTHRHRPRYSISSNSQHRTQNISCSLITLANRSIYVTWSALVDNCWR